MRRKSGEDAGKKGIALKFVAEVIIAIVAAFVVLSIFQSLLPSTSTSILCRIYRVILALPIPASIKPTITECTIQPITERFVVSDTEKDKIVENLATNALRCWQEKADDGKLGITFICYELLLKKSDADITESDFATFLKQKGYCDALPDNFLDVERTSFDCGNLNKVMWKIGTISGSDVTVIIKFNGQFSQHWLEIV